MSFLFFIFSGIPLLKLRDSLKPETWICTLGTDMKSFKKSLLFLVWAARDRGQVSTGQSGEILIFCFFRFFHSLSPWLPGNLVVAATAAQAHKTASHEDRQNPLSLASFFPLVSPPPDPRQSCGCSDNRHGSRGNENLKTRTLRNSQESIPGQKTQKEH